MRYLLLLLALVPSLASAWCETEFCGFTFAPYAGLDHQWRKSDYQKDKGSNLFKMDYPQGNVFLGARFHDYASIEAGHQFTPMRTRTAYLDRGETVLGVFPTRAPERHITKCKITGWNIGLLGHFPIFEIKARPVELLGYVGRVALRAYHQDILLQDNTGPLDFMATKKTFIKRASVWKFGMGAQYVFKAIGIRGMIGFENTNRFKDLKPDESKAGKRRLSLKDTTLMSAGMFVTTP